MAALFLVLFGLCFYYIPFIIAVIRRHHYKWVILGINTVGFVGVVPWIGAFIWSVWPSEKSLIDPIAGNVTGKGYKNFGDTLGAINHGKKRGFLEEQKQSNIEDNDLKN
tara:strand:+ start:513 stop:839 length:327 start_codon:yes stop_codon:yes gene_type:complete